MEEGVREAGGSRNRRRRRRGGGNLYSLMGLVLFTGRRSSW